MSASQNTEATPPVRCNYGGGQDRLGHARYVRILRATMETKAREVLLGNVRLPEEEVLDLVFGLHRRPVVPRQLLAVLANVYAMTAAGEALVGAEGTANSAVV